MRRLAGQAVQEVDEAREVHLLVVVHDHVAPVRAQQVLPAGQPAGHHLQVPMALCRTRAMPDPR